MSAWSEDETEELRRLRAKGLSFGQIARALGRTRNSCVSMANRNGLPRLESPAGRIPTVRKTKRPTFVPTAAEGRDSRDLMILDEAAAGASLDQLAAKWRSVARGYIEDLIQAWKEAA